MTGDLGRDDTGRPYTGSYDPDTGWDTAGGYPPIGTLIAMPAGGVRAPADAQHILTGSVLTAGVQGITAMWDDDRVGHIGPDHFPAIRPAVDWPRYRARVYRRPDLDDDLPALARALHARLCRPGTHSAASTGDPVCIRAMETVSQAIAHGRVEVTPAPDDAVARWLAGHRLTVNTEVLGPPSQTVAHLQEDYARHAAEQCPLDIRPGDPADD